MSTIKKGLSFLTIASGFFLISGYLINIILARILGPNDYGIYGILISFISLVNIIQTSGLTQSISRHISVDEKNSSSIIKSGIIIQFVSLSSISAFIFFCAPLIAQFFRDSSLIPYIRLSAFIFPLFGIYALFSDIHNGFRHFKKQAVMNIFYSVTKLICVIVGGYFFGLVGIILGLALASIPSIFYGFVRINFRMPHYPFKKILLFSIPLLGFAFFSNALISVDIFIIKILLHDNTQAGFYAAAQNIARIPYFALNAFFMVMFPVISKSVSSDKLEVTRGIIQKTIRLVFILLIPLIVYLSVFSKSFINVIYSTTYLESSASLSILVIGMGLFALLTILNYILSGAGYPYFSFTTAVIGIIINILFNLILVPQFGIMGAALSTTLSIFIITMLSVYKLHTWIGPITTMRTVINLIIVSIIIFTLSSLISIPVTYLPVALIVLSAIYAIALLTTNEISKSELSTIKSLIPFNIKNFYSNEK